MKIAYLQCPTGIAGDMCLGAIVDAGVPLEYLIEQLGRLGIAQEYKLWTEQVHRNGQRATKFHVDLVFAAGETFNPDAFNTFDHRANEESLHHPSHSRQDLPVSSKQASSSAAHRASGHAHEAEEIQAHRHVSASHPHTDAAPHAHLPVRHLPEIEQLIRNAQLPTRVEVWSLAVFRTLAVAEGAVHGVPPEQVHFHEVGATDALVDIIGTCLGLAWLGVDRVVCSPLPAGGGTIRAAHGRLPVPAPAVLQLFEMGQVPLYSNGIEREMVTPTGAAIAVTLAEQFGPPPTMTLQKVGLGAGSSEFALPNILRLWIGVEREGQAAGSEQRAASSGQRQPASEGDEEQGREGAAVGRQGGTTETVLLLETQIDDLNPQAIGFVLERLLEAGALDVFTQAIAMKKSRPGILLTVVCRPEDRAKCEAMLFRETTTLGIRCVSQERRVLPREIQMVETEFGPVRVKVAWAEGCDQPPTNVQPEYEDCAQLARVNNVAWRDIHRAALQSWDNAINRG